MRHADSNIADNPNEVSLLPYLYDVTESENPEMG